MDERGKTYEQLEDIELKQDLMFLIDVMNHLQALNLSLQWKDKIESDLAQTILSFQSIIKLLQRDNSSQHFPLLKGLLNSENDLCSERVKVYVESLDGSSTYFSTWFSGIQNLEPSFAFLVNLFVVDVFVDDVRRSTVERLSKDVFVPKERSSVRVQEKTGI